MGSGEVVDIERRVELGGPLHSKGVMILSAFLGALTVTAVIITVAAGFYGVYHRVASGKKFHHDHDASTDDSVIELHREDTDGSPV